MKQFIRLGLSAILAIFLWGQIQLHAQQTETSQKGYYFTLSFENETPATKISFQEFWGYSDPGKINIFTDLKKIRYDPENTDKPTFIGDETYVILVLKYGIVPLNAPITQWCLQSLEGGELTIRNIIISLMDASDKPVKQWQVSDAAAASWTHNEPSSSSNPDVLAVSEIEFRFKSIMPINTN